MLAWALAGTACSGGSSPPPDGGTDAGRDAGADGGEDGGPVDADATCTSDSVCDDGLYCNGYELCRPEAASADARGCVAGELPCPAVPGCDEDTDECLGPCGGGGDADGDGRRSIECGGDDCDDSDPLRFPGAAEICDVAHRDEDCDPSTFGFRDADGDFFADARCCNMVDGTPQCGTDCDDANPGVHPTATEACEGLDNDCDGSIDEGVQSEFWPDADGDGYGDATAAAILACLRPTGTAETHDDCDDARAATHPGAREACDGAGLDDDCDGNVDESCECTTGDSRPCSSPGVCAAGTEQCVDGLFGACSIAATTETCNNLDDDCNGVVDDGLRVDCWSDDDDDGYATMDATRETQCTAAGRASVGGCPPNWTNRPPIAPNLDCDDTNDSTRPGGTEICNTVDDDCDGDVDEGLTTACYADADGDGYAAAGAVQTAQCGACAPGTTSRAPTLGNVDCRDMLADTYPGAPELCDRRDNDCSSGGGTDTNEDGDGDGYTSSGYTGCSGGPLLPGDCHDGVAAMHPGQTAYFSSPVCQFAGYYNPCTCPSGAAGCTFSNMGCVCVTETRFWDYDCNGSVAQNYRGAAPDCSTRCTSPGYCSPAQGVTETVECGEPVTFRYCSGSCPDGCAAVDRVYNQSCH